MRNFRFAVLALALAACTGSPTVHSEPSYLVASLAGHVQADYTGDGTFMILPPGTSAYRFTLASTGTANGTTRTGFILHLAGTPSPGVFTVDAESHDQFFLGVWQEDGDVQRHYRARSGRLTIDHSTATRQAGRLAGAVSGTFDAVLVLHEVCRAVPAFPAPVARCEAAAAPATIQVAGSFRAGPLGGDDPGLLLPD